MNNDVYAEWLVKCKKPAYTIPFYIGMVFLTLISIMVSITTPFGFIALLAVAGLWYFGTMRLKVEYEYVFVTNELAIDRILSQRSRKRMQKIEMQKIEKMASMRSKEFEYVKGNPQIKTVDYSSKTPDAVTYGIAYTGEKGKFLYIIEPNENLLKCMKSSAPSKVKIDQSITMKN